MSELFTEDLFPEDLDTFDSSGYSNADALMLAESLLEDAIPCIETILPTLNAKDKLLAKFAVLEMAKFIQVDFLNFDRATSPFQSETVGSYSYSKMVRAVREGDATNVPGFDRAVSKLAALCENTDSGAFSSSSEVVFQPGYDNFINRRERGQVASGYVWLQPDPSRQKNQ